MKLLIVDDEELTRVGIVTSFDWKLYGITSIYQAEDGLQGLSIAKKNTPDIVLSDVRMPRMDGIEMANRIRSILPDCHIIFMSGFSDREYLKAAIKLKAITYIEKPIDLEEMSLAFQEIIQKHKTNELVKNSTDIYLQDQSKRFLQDLISLDFNYSQESEYYKTVLQSVGVENTGSAVCSVMILKSCTPLSALPSFEYGSFMNTIRLEFPIPNCRCIIADRQDEYIVFLLFYKEKLREDKLLHIGQVLSSSFSHLSKNFIAIGKAICGLQYFSKSYQSAVILLQSAFFYDYNSVLTEPSKEISKVLNTDEIIEDVRSALSSRNKEKCLSISNSLFHSLKNTHVVLVDTVRAVYYKLFLLLQENAMNFRLTLAPPGEHFDYVLGQVSSIPILNELHGLWLEKLNLFFTDNLKQSEESSTVYMIKEYIAGHFSNEHLSVRDISNHVFLSSTYVCTIFKNETGQTLNQYITEYRVEYAKKLLKDPRYKITDISLKVGYSDGNYFGKIFKKSVGMSPSEFREHSL